LEYKNAERAYQEAVSLNPNDIQAQLALVNREMRVGKGQEALNRSLQALSLAKQNHKEEHLDIAKAGSSKRI
jgi:tetratricopeptide (TPR) repeat protein